MSETPNQFRRVLDEKKDTTIDLLAGLVKRHTGKSLSSAILIAVGYFGGPALVEKTGKVLDRIEQVPAIVQQVGEVKSSLGKTVGELQEKVKLDAGIASSFFTQHTALDKEVSTLKESVLRQNTAIADRLTKQEATLSKQWEIISAQNRQIAELNTKIEVLKATLNK